MCVAHGGAMRREPPQRSEDIESITAKARDNPPHC